MSSCADDSLTDCPGVAAGRFERPTRQTELFLLLFAGVYLVVFSEAVPTWLDEAYSFNLASDSSLTHMFSALRAGADGSFPLYALVLYGWAKIFGSSEMSLRLNSGVFVLLLVWQMSRRLARYFGPAVAALSILFLLADQVFAYYAVQARFYGLVVFLFSLCFWSTWDLLQNQPASLTRRLYHALLCGLLCLSHPLGLVYTGILAFLYVGFSWSLKRFSWANSAAFLGGPALFLFWLPAFLHQRLVNPVYIVGRAVWLKYWQFAFFDSVVLFLTLLIGLAANERNSGIVCESHVDAFYLATRTPAQDVKYLLSTNFGFKNLMLQIERFYPRPAPVEPDTMSHYTNDYLYLSYSPRNAFIVSVTNR